MLLRIYSSQYTTGDANLLVPSFLVKVKLLVIELVEEARVADVKLMGCYSDDRACI